MSERLEAIITARDNASATFKKVGDSAEQMGDDIEQSAKASGRSLKELEQDAKNLGLGIGVMVGAAALAGQSFRDQEIALNTLRRTYGDAATGLEEFSRALAENSNYSEEAIVNAANVAATLSRNYGATAAEIQQILQISADLAATSGYAFEDAAQRVVAALRGEAEAAEMLGLTMNQQSIDRENLTLSMSNQEAFQFRLNALTEQSAFAMGAAAERADTTYGSMVNLEGSIRDAGQAFGDFLGPFGEIGAYAADNAIQVALFSAGLVKLGQAALAARSLIGVTGLAGAIGPAGLVAAVGLAAYALHEFESNIDSATLNLERMDAATADLDATVRQLFATGNQLAYLGEQGLALFPGIEQDIENMSNLESRIATLMATGGPQNDQQRELLAGWQADLDGLIQKYGELDSAQLESTEYSRLFADAQEAFNQILTHTGVGAADAQAALRGVIEGFEAGTMTAPEFAEVVIVLAGGLSTYDELATDAAASTEELGTSMARSAEDVLALADALSSSLAAANVVSPGLHSVLDVLGLLSDELSGGGRFGASPGLQSILAVMQEINDLSGGGRGAGPVLESMRGGLGEVLGATQELIAELEENLVGAFESVRSEVNATTDALNAGFQTAISNTNAIASQSQAVADWAEELIKAEGVYSKLDDLVNAGRITGESGVFSGSSEYAQAQQAFNSIIADNAQIQEHVLTIQAKQAPVMAELVAQQEAYMESLAGGSMEQQTFALAMMDSATSAQALEMAQAAIGDMDTFGPMLVQAAELNPYLASIFEQMGLIQEVDGEIVLTADAEGAKSEVQLLTDAITALTQAIHVAFIDTDTSGAQAGFEAADTWFSSWDGSVATAEANVNDNASSTLINIGGLLRGLDGRVATATVVTNHVSTGSTRGFLPSGHGGIAGHALGGVTAYMGEWGDELLRLGTGGLAMTRGRGLYHVPENTYVTPAPATRQITDNFGGTEVHVHIENLYGDETLAEKVSAEIVPGVLRAMKLVGGGR